MLKILEICKESRKWIKSIQFVVFSTIFYSILKNVHKLWNLVEFDSFTFLICHIHITGNVIWWGKNECRGFYGYIRFQNPWFQISVCFLKKKSMSIVWEWSTAQNVLPILTNLVFGHMSITISIDVLFYFVDKSKFDNLRKNPQNYVFLNRL